MAEYRIVAKIDPQTAAGSTKVKQDLRGIQNEAKATEAAMNRSFDQAKFDRTIGGLVTRIEQLDKSVTGLSQSNGALQRSNETLGQSLDRLAASSVKAAQGAQQAGKGASDEAKSQAQLEAAMRRVLQAVDQEAAEQARLNALLADAKRLLDAGTISQEQYAKVQRLASQSAQELNQRTAAQRIGMQQLGFQLGDIATMYSLGAKPAQIFASQIGQVTQAVQLMAGGTSSFATFLQGPWGIALTVGTILLAPFVAKLFEGNDALGESVEKMQEDARATEVNRRAKEIFKNTIEGATEAMIAQNKALRESIETQRDSLTQAAAEARVREQVSKGAISDLEQRVSLAQKELKALQESARYNTDPNAAAGLALVIGQQAGRVEDLQNQLAKARENSDGFSEAVRRADAAMAQYAATLASDPVARITEQYKQRAEALIETAVQNKTSNEVLARELTLLELQKKKAIEAAQAQERLNKAGAQGVAVFKSREQAIGIAGRELQSGGLRVGENQQFGGVTGNHPGMGNSAHGRYAIDVNSGAGVVEADVPDIRSRFDALARRYQARGYRVLWNGQVYEAGGNGPTRPIPSGQNQHRDHMHLEAPGTIVGKATQASTETQARQEDAQAARVQAQASDFVQAIVDRSASAGLPQNSQTQLNAQIDEALAEFRRRFDREATAGERATITKALTDAETREIAQRFEEAYVRPLDRLKALQGTVGLDRQILNQKLEETERLGRALTPVEEKMIENSVRQGDALQREAQTLEQIRAPLLEYQAQIEVLNGLLAKGEINQTQFNARIAEMQQAAAGALGGVNGVDPNSGRTYEDVGAVADENARYAQQLEDFANHRDQLLQLGIDYNALEEQAYQQHITNLAQIDQARKDLTLATYEQMFGSITSIAGDAFGKQSAIYKAAFATEKAVAIARSIVAIQTGIAQASSLPFPANLAAMATVAAQTASIVSNISSVVLAFKDGGYVSGPGGSRSDDVPARLSNGEFVVNADATAQNRSLLEAINSGRTVRQVAAAGVAATGGGAARSEPVVVPAPQVNQRFITVLDPGLVGDFLATPDGEEAVLNIIQRNPEAVPSGGGR